VDVLRASKSLTNVNVPRARRIADTAKPLLLPANKLAR